MRLQPFMVLALAVLGTLVAPAAAQQDERFFGRWEGASTSSGYGSMFIERNGYLSNLSADGQRWFVQKYQVIKDFGDRVVVRASNLRFPEGDINRHDLVILHLYKEGIYRSRRYIVLSEEFCGGGDEGRYFYQDDDPDAIWRRVMEWTARASEGFPYNRCGLTARGENTGEGWGGVGWFRYIDQ